MSCSREFAAPATIRYALDAYVCLHTHFASLKLREFKDRGGNDDKISSKTLNHCSSITLWNYTEFSKCGPSKSMSQRFCTIWTDTLASVDIRPRIRLKCVDGSTCVSWMCKWSRNRTWVCIQNCIFPAIELGPYGVAYCGASSTAIYHSDKIWFLCRLLVLIAANEWKK